MGIKHKKQPQTTQNTTKTAQNQSDDLTFKEYLREFRGRLLWFGGSFLVAAVIGFEFKDVIQGLVTMQLADLNLINLAAADDMQSTLQISLLVGVIVSVPLAFYHVYRFLEPVINRGTTYATRLVGSSVILTILAIAYAFMLTIPLGLGGMANRSQDASILHVTTQTFLTFAVTNVLVTIVVAQLPLAIIFANNIQSFSKKRAAWVQRIILPVILIAAWIATPFHSMNRGIAGTLLIAVPAVFAFEAAMFWAKKQAKASLPVAAPVGRQSAPLTNSIASWGTRWSRLMSHGCEVSQPKQLIF